MSEPFDLRASVSAALDLPEDARGTMCAEDGVSILELHAALVRYRQWLASEKAYWLERTRNPPHGDPSLARYAADFHQAYTASLAAFDQAVTL